MYTIWDQQMNEWMLPYRHTHSLIQMYIIILEIEYDITLEIVPNFLRS